MKAAIPTGSTSARFSLRPVSKLAAFVTAAIVAGGLAVGLASCGGSSEEGGTGLGGNPCADELADSCGQPCDATTACPGGLYCSAGACTADCLASGSQCTADGHVMGDGPILSVGGPGTSGGAGTGGVAVGPGCIQQGIEFESLTPTVVLLVDRSASMTADFGGQDRWNTIRDILVEPTMGFVALLQDKVRFGLTLYTGLTADDPGGPSCPNLIDVPIAFSNYQMIHDVFMANEVGNNTPTAESFTVVTGTLAAYQDDPPGPKERALNGLCSPKTDL